MKPGVQGFGGLDPGAALLAEEIQVAPGDRVLELQCGAGLVGSLAALLAVEGQVFLLDSNAASVTCARHTVQANMLPNAQVYASAATQIVRPLEAVNVVAMRLPKGRQFTQKLVWDAFHALRPGGRFYLAGGNREGIKPALEMARSLFGEMSVSAYRRGFRVGFAYKRSDQPADPTVFGDPWLDSAWFEEFPVQLRGKTYFIRSRPGIFSWERLDPGTQALIEALDLRVGDTVLDLGCGYGIIGTVAADLAPEGRVMLLDADVTAVEAAGQTLARNGIINGEVRLSDCGEEIRDRRFDVVATNPPFHEGKSTSQVVARQFIEDAARLLVPGGRFYLVANRFLPYEKEIAARFGKVEPVYTDGRYKVLLAQQ